MKKTSPLILIWTIFFISGFSVWSQERNKFGLVTHKDLQTLQFEQDTNAAAVILFDKGHLHSTGRFVRHVRVKVLKSSGTTFTNFHVQTPSKSGIDGITFNLENGKIVETPLSRNNIFREENEEGRSTYKIFFPNVKAGSIVDLQYVFAGVPYVWRFQDLIPVLYSELTLDHVRNLSFKKTLFGSEKVENVGSKWFAKNVPAFVKEPFMCHYQNYLTHFRIDLERMFYVDISSDWQRVGEHLMASRDFGGVLNGSPFLNEKARQIKELNATVPEKIKLAVDYINENMRWNNWLSEYATIDIVSNFKKNHSGNSAEINLLLIALLNKAGISTYPAILSTRENGLLNPASASISTVNYVLGYVKMIGNEMLVDATDPLLTPGMIPVHCRNVSAYVIMPPFGQWVDTSTGKGNTRKQFISMQLREDGSAVANVSNTFQDYDFIEWLEKFNEFGSIEAYLEKTRATIESEVHESSLKIDSGGLRAIETRSIDITNTAYAEDLGNEIVLSPFLFSDLENPFKDENRRHPVDFIFPRNRSIIVSIEMPSNYSLRALPEAVAFRPEYGGARFSYQTSFVNNVLTIYATLQVERQIFPENEYAPLRNFFVSINRKLTEAIQIDKNL